MRQQGLLKHILVHFCLFPFSMCFLVPKKAFVQTCTAFMKSINLCLCGTKLFALGGCSFNLSMLQ